MRVLRERIRQVYTCLLGVCVLYSGKAYPHFFVIQVISMYLLVILALKLRMLLCLHAFLYSLVVRKF